MNPSNIVQTNSWEMMKPWSIWVQDEINVKNAGYRIQLAIQLPSTYWFQVETKILNPYPTVMQSPQDN
jgi:hypothetical protein